MPSPRNLTLTPEQDRYVVAHAGHQTTREIAKHLSRDRCAVDARVRQLHAAGRIPGRARPWLGVEKEEVLRLVQTYSLPEIAQMLGRSVWSLQKLLADLTGTASVKRLRSSVVPSDEAARRLGISPDRLREWGRLGHLQRVPHGPACRGKVGAYALTEDELRRVAREMADSLSSWTMPPGPLRETVERSERERQLHGPALLTTKATAHRFGLTLSPIRKAIAQGHLPAVRLPGQGRVWFVRPEDADAWARDHLTQPRVQAQRGDNHWRRRR